MPRPDPIATARRLVNARWPDCLAAILGGSVVRGDATPTSDLDLVIVTAAPEAPYRESLRFDGWPVEAFVHSPTSYRAYFASDAARRRPSLPRMCAEGVLLKDTDGLAAQIKAEARALLAAGPEPLTPDEISAYRYRLTDLLDDLAGADDHPEEALYIAAEIVPLLAEMQLAANRHWIGSGKWIPRALRRVDPALADRLTAAFRAAAAGDAAPLLACGEDVLAPLGGRLFDGYRLGGRRG